MNQNQQKPKPTQQSQHQQSQALNRVQQHLHQTEPELDAQLEEYRQSEDYDHFVRTPDNVRTVLVTDADHMTTQTINPAQLLLQPKYRQQVEQAQTQQTQALQQQRSHGFPFFAIPAIAHDVTYPQYPQQPP